MLQFTLQQKGFSCVDLCEDGNEAISIIRKKGLNHYSLVFMDNVMPVMNGLETSKQLRKMGYKNLLIGVTGNAVRRDDILFIIIIIIITS
jgi:CheY-like chemotaxis protein